MLKNQNIRQSMHNKYDTLSWARCVPGFAARKFAFDIISDQNCMLNQQFYCALITEITPKNGETH